MLAQLPFDAILSGDTNRRLSGGFELPNTRSLSSCNESRWRWYDSRCGADRRGRAESCQRAAFGTPMCISSDEAHKAVRLHGLIATHQQISEFPDYYVFTCCRVSRMKSSAPFIRVVENSNQTKHRAASEETRKRRRTTAAILPAINVPIGVVPNSGPTHVRPTFRTSSPPLGVQARKVSSS